MDFKTLYGYNAAIYADQSRRAYQSYINEQRRIDEYKKRKLKEAREVDEEIEAEKKRKEQEEEIVAQQKQKQKQNETAIQQQQAEEEEKRKSSRQQFQTQQRQSQTQQETKERQNQPVVLSEPSDLVKSLDSRRKSISKFLKTNWKQSLDKIQKQKVLDNKRRRTTPARVASLTQEAQELLDTAQELKDSNPSAHAQLMREYQDTVNKRDKELNWYFATDPNKKEEQEPGAEYWFGDIFGTKQNGSKDKKSLNQTFWQDFYHTWGISKNQVQMQTSLGKIQMLDQQLELANPSTLDRYQKVCQDYIRFKGAYDNIMQRYVSGKGVSKEEYKALDGLKSKYQSLANEKNTLEDRFKNLSSFEASWGLGWISDIQSTLNKVNADFGTGVGGSLQGYTDKITQFQQALAKGDMSSANKLKKDVNDILKQFSNRGKQMRELWKKDYDIDKEDLKKYTEDGYRISDYYKQKEQAAQKLAWYSPSKMWMSASLLGSSMSSPEKTAMSFGAGLTALLGTALLPETSGTSVSLIAGGASFLFSMAAGADENFANVADATDTVAKKDLLEKGLTSTFMNDAKAVLGENTEIDDALHAFYAGKYVPNNSKVRQALLDATAGSAKQYFQGMGVNTWDSLVDAIVTCVPMGGIAKASKVGFVLDKTAALADKGIRKVGGRALLKRQVAKYMEQNQSSIKEALKAVRGAKGPVTNVLNGARSVLNKPANWVRSMTKDIADYLYLPVLKTAVLDTINNTVDKALAKMAEKSLKHAAGVVDIATAIPERVLRYRSALNTVGKGVVDFGWRVGASMYSEGAEEGLQQLQQYQRIEERSNQYYNVLNQLPLTVLDGMKLWSSFLFKDPSKASAQERDIWEQMHGGILGSLLQGMPSIAVQTGYGTYRQYSLHQVVMNNLLADHISETDYLAKARVIAQELRKGNYGRIMATIQHYANVTQDMQQRHKDDHNWAIPKGHVANLKKLVNTIEALKLSETVQNTAKAAGFLQEHTGKKGAILKILSKKARKKAKEQNQNYDSYLAVLAGRMNSMDESQEFYDNKVKELIGQRFQNSGSFEEYLHSMQAQDSAIPQLLTKIEKGEDGQWKLSEQYKDDANLQNELDRLRNAYLNRNEFAEGLHSLLAYMQTKQLLSDMEAIKNLKGGETLSKRAAHEVDRMQKYIRERFGDNVKLDTEDDVKTFAQQHGITIDDDYTEALRGRNDALLQLEFNTEMYNKLLTNSEFAKSSVKSYLENKKEDELLRQSVEDNFLENELDRQARNNTVIDNSNHEFVKDGIVYSVRPDDDGNAALYEYDEVDDQFVKSNKKFDFDEWYDARKERDEYRKSRESVGQQFDDYKRLSDKNSDELTDEEKERLKTYESSALDKFERYNRESEEYDRVERELKRAREMGKDALNKTQAHLIQFFNDRSIKNKRRKSEIIKTLSENIDDFNRSRLLQIENMVQRGEDVYSNVDSNKKKWYHIGDIEVSYDEYVYAKWYSEHINDIADEYIEPNLSRDSRLQGPTQEPQGKGSQKQYHGRDITNEQDRVLNSLEEYKASQSKYHYEWRSGNTYFIEENGVVHAYKRLHSVLDPQFKPAPEKVEAIKRNVKRLQDKRDAWIDAIDNNKPEDEIKRLKEAYWDEMVALRTEYLEIAARVCGTDSEMYHDLEQNVLGGYEATEEIMKSDDTINAIADLFAHDGDNLFIPGASVISGTIIDGIARRVINHEDVKYDSEFKMSEDTFNKLVSDIVKWRDLMENSGFVLVTDPLCWHTELFDKNGQSVGLVAGESDMIAISPTGEITLIDFKTSKRSFETEKRTSSSSINETTGEITTGEDFDYIDALDKVYTGKFGARQQRTARDFYTSQTNAYAQMIIRCTSAKVTSIQLMGFTTDISNVRGNYTLLHSINSVRPLRMVDIAITDPIFASESYVVNRDEIKRQISEIKERCKIRISNISIKIKSLQQLLDDLDEFVYTEQINKFIDAFVQRYVDNDDVSGIETVNLANATEAYLNTAEEYVDDMISKVIEEISEQKKRRAAGEGPHADRSKFKIPHRVHDASLVSAYNRTAPIQNKSTIPEIAEDIELFKQWTTEPDFLEHVQFEVDFTSGKDHFIAGVAGPNSLHFKSISYKGHTLHPGAVASIIFYWANDTTNTSLRNRLLDFYTKNKADIISGKKKVVLTNLSRTNGVLQYNNPLTNVQSALELDEDDMGELFNYNDPSKAVVLVSDTEGVLRRLDSSDGKVGSGTAERVADRPENRNKPGIIFIQKPLGYVEDENASDKHTALIPLTPMKMSESTVDLIISILTGTGNKAQKAKCTDQNGNEIEGHIDNSTLLHTLIRFGKGAERTGNKFQFDYVTEDGKVNYNSVYISKDGGTTREIYNLHNIDDVARLKSVLLKDGYLNVQETTLLRDSMDTSRDSGLFHGLKQWFDTHPDVQSIKYSDELIFDREDVKINRYGIEWMIKNNWVMSEYSGISNAIVSASDFKVMEEDETNTSTITQQIEEEQEVLNEEIPSTPQQKEGGVDNSNFKPTIEDSIAAFDDNDFSLFMTQTGRTKHLLNTDEKIARAVADIKRICGDSVPVSMVKSIIMHAANGDVVGMCTAAGIVISQAAENGAQYHEAFHRIVELAMPTEARELLYKWYRNKFEKDKKFTERDVAEGLADLFFEYGRHAWHPKGVVAKWFARIYNYLNALVQVKSFKIAATFRAIDYGKYANNKITRRSKRLFRERFGNTLYMTMVDKNGVNREFPHIYTHTQLNDAIECLIPKLVQAFGIDILGLNLDKLVTNKQSLVSPKSPFYKTYTSLTMQGVTEETLDDYVKEGKISPLIRDNLLIMRDLFENWDVIQPKLEAKLKSFGIQARKDEDEEKKNNTDAGDQSAVASDIDGHSDEFYSHSLSRDVAAPIVFRLSTIKNVRYVTHDDVAAGLAPSIYILDKEGHPILDSNGQKKRAVIPVKRNSLGMVTYLPFKSVHQRLLSELHDVKNVDDLYNRLTTLGKNDYMFAQIASTLYRLRNQSYVRMTDKKTFGDYVGWPIVKYGNAILKPEYYIADPKVHDNGYKYPQQVRLVKDLKNKHDEVICKAGQVLQGAVYAQNQDLQSLTTLLFQAVKSQKLNFKFLRIRPARDENGKVVEGKFNYGYENTNTDQAASRLPIQWFDNVRQGFTGIYNADGSVNKNYQGFAQSLHTLTSVVTGLVNMKNNTARIDGVQYNLSDVEAFDKVVGLVISAFNNIGVTVTKPIWYHMLHKMNPTSSDYVQSFIELMTASKRAGLSIYSLIGNDGVLAKLDGAVKAGNLNMFSKDQVVGKGNNAQMSGAYMYVRNSFIQRLAVETSAYRTATSEMMTIGAGNTKMYMYAQNNTVSDVVEDLNNSLDDDGSVRDGSILSDMQNVVYCQSEYEGMLCSSVILKQLSNPEFNKGHNRIEVFTEAGSKMSQSQDGSVKFSEMAKREDYLSRMTKLSEGYLIMPTLSDKSTYMCINGFKLPGFDYHASDKSQFGRLPLFSSIFGHMGFSMHDLNSRSVHEDAGNVINQFIQYFHLELNNVEKTLGELGLIGDGSAKLNENELIENYHTKNKSGARFLSMTGVYIQEKNEKGETVDVFVPFNKKTKDGTDGILEGYHNAKKYFFDKSYEEKCAIVARILQHRLDEELDKLVEAGIIQVEQNDNTSNKNKKYYNFKNRYLDNDKIKMLASLYGDVDVQLKNGTSVKMSTLKNSQKLESLAVVAYVYDTMCKQLMSMEESRRFFTGMPQFFKTDYNENGVLSVVGNDETKRYGGLGSTGSNNREDIPGIPEDYKVAEIKDWETPSVVQDSLREMFRESEYKAAVVNLRLSKEQQLSPLKRQFIYQSVYEADIEELRKELKEAGILDICDAKAESNAASYGKINVTDGSAFITDKLAENLLKQRGAFTTQVEEAFKTLRGNNDYYLSNSKAYSIIFNALISTQKYSAFGYRMQNGTPVHFYNKFALFPIFKGISYGFLKHLYEKMNDEKHGVDMVMMQSAVKAGSQGAQDFNPSMSAEEIANFSFKDHIYTQKYKWIRRQLNTDPRTEELMSVGTQPLKIVMSTLRFGQTYNIKNIDGTTSKLEASAVRDKIMGIINRLAEIGWTELTNDFKNPDGSIDIKKLQQFLVNQLSSRDADRNLMDALQLTPDGTAFQADLNSVSNAAWVESILTSEVNKRVIDVVMKGNAFYQRSVYGMDSPYTRVGEDSLPSSINNGKPLRMINEEGSMDAVVSIDYFNDIIPRHLRNNFKKAKQFLIDNGVISGVKTGETKWNNASANTMSYRIPTQAASSIGALRFVDVLPIVRDTIVLPKEFTAQTGSDFDIDKIYMSTLHFEKKMFKETYKNAEGETKTRESFTLSTTEFENEKDRLSNELLLTYFSLLKDTGQLQDDGKIKGGNYANILRRSIDKDTQLVKQVLEELESSLSSETYEPYQFEMLSSQVDTRASFATGKVGIGPFALNNNNQVLTQIYGVDFIDDDGILSALGRLKLSDPNDIEGNPISSWISAMINAHVDVAKDPYILRMNVNKATYNLTNLLIRTGFGRHTLYFLNTKIVKDLSQIYNECEGQIVDDPGISPTQRKKNAEIKYIRDKFGVGSLAQMYAEASLSDQKQYEKESLGIIKEIFGKPFGGNAEINGNTILQYMAIHQDESFDDKKKISINGVLYSYKDIQTHLYIAMKSFTRYAEELSKLVQYTKIDTKKQGINVADQREYLRNYNELRLSMMFNNNLIEMLDNSYIDIKTTYGTQFVSDILGDKMIHMTDRFNAQLNIILDNINNRSKNTRNAVQNAMLCYIKQKCFNYAFDDYIQEYNQKHGTNYTSESYWMSLITGPRTLASRIRKVQQMILNDKDGTFKEFGQNGVITNEILAHLYNVAHMSAPGTTHYNIVSLTNTTEDDSSNINEFIDAWEQMLNYTNEENLKLQESFRNLANDLAIYAFMTSADSKGFTKFFKYVPLSWRKSFGYDKYIHQAFEEYNNTIDFSENETLGRFDVDYDDFIQNFMYDNNIIPELRMKTANGNDRFITSTFLYNKISQDGSIIQAREPRNIIGLTQYKDKYGSPISKNSNGEFPMYVKIRRSGINFSDQDKFLLYRLVDVGTVTDGQLALEYPVYQIVDSKGLQLQIGAQTYQFYSCGRESNYDRVQFSTENKQGQKIVPKMEAVLQAYANRKAKLQEFVKGQHMSISDAVKQVGFLSKRDILNTGKLTKTQERAFEGLISDNKFMNINYGLGDNPHLSNFADRPIADIFEGLQDPRIKNTQGLQHGAIRVENAFQALKVFYSNSLTNKDGSLTEDGKVLFNSIINAKSGREARAKGKNIPKLDVKSWSQVSQKILGEMMFKSFNENEDAKNELQKTLGKTFTHLNRKGEIMDSPKNSEEEYSPFVNNLTAIRQRLFGDNEDFMDYEDTGSTDGFQSYKIYKPMSIPGVSQDALTKLRKIVNLTADALTLKDGFGTEADEISHKMKYSEFKGLKDSFDTVRDCFLDTDYDYEDWNKLVNYDKKTKMMTIKSKVIFEWVMLLDKHYDELTTLAAALEISGFPEAEDFIFNDQESVITTLNYLVYHNYDTVSEAEQSLFPEFEFFKTHSEHYGMSEDAYKKALRRREQAVSKLDMTYDESFFNALSEYIKKYCKY